MITQIFRIAKNARRKSSGEGKLNRLSIFVLLFSILFFSTLYSLLSTSAYAEAVSSSELINNAKKYDVKFVDYEGEVIGDIMVRGDYTWLNVNDGQNAIGIWVSKDLTKDITHTGSYKVKGDWIEINGIFHRACPEHGGDLDIHARTLKIVKHGSAVSEAVSALKVKAIITLFIICLMVLAVYFIKIGYRSRK